MIASVARLDVVARGWVVAHRAELLNPIMWATSAVGRGGMLWLAVGGAFVIGRRIRLFDFVQLALAILLASLLANQVLKPLIARERPFLSAPEPAVIGGKPKDSSFPSGHAANAFAGCGVLSRKVPRARPVWWVLATLIAYSRVYLGVHYPLDVIGGALLGLTCALLVERLGRAADKV